MDINEARAAVAAQHPDWDSSAIQNGAEGMLARLAVLEATDAMEQAFSAMVAEQAAKQDAFVASLDDGPAGLLGHFGGNSWGSHSDANEAAWQRVLDSAEKANEGAPDKAAAKAATGWDF